MTTKTSKTGQSVVLPWGAWFAETTHRLALPAGWSVDRLEPPARDRLGPDAIARALADPIEAAPLAEQARAARTVCIAVDDLARPTRAGDVLPAVLDELHRGGIADHSVRIVVATGVHSRPEPGDVALKIGARAAASLAVEIHDPGSSVVETAISYGNRRLRVNRTFLESDLKIGIGSVLPHPFAGYSGGAKVLLPGLADLEATDRSHKFVRMGLRGGADPEENGFRREIEAIARQLGFAFTICCVPTASGETAGLFAGDVVAAHRRACQAAACAYATRVEKTYDCLIVNAYPKDTELVQADGALVALKSAGRSIVREGGVLVLATAASRGIGGHRLFAPGGICHREPAPRREFSSHEFWLYAPSLSEAEVRSLYWSGYPFFQSGARLSAALEARLGARACAAVLPSGPLQIVTNR